VANKVVPYTVPSNILDHVKETLSQEQLKEFMQLFEATGIEKAKLDQVKKLKSYLEQHPELSLLAGSLDEWMQRRIVSSLAHNPALREVTIANLEVMRRELGHGQASPLEQTLIEHVVTCWLRFQEVSHWYQNHMDKQHTLTSGEYWEKRLTAAQRRYLRAVETLARVRKLTQRMPEIQLNIAKQQIVANG
jgi:hypothetical protein